MTPERLAEIKALTNSRREKWMLGSGDFLNIIEELVEAMESGAKKRRSCDDDSA